jgi:hypothetical protein
MGDNETVVVVDADHTSCEFSDKYMALVSLVASAVLVGAFQVIPEKNIFGVASLVLWVFSVLLCNHMYIVYAQAQLAPLGDMIPSLVQWTPVFIGFVLFLAASHRQNVLAVLFAGGTTAYFVTYFDSYYTWISIGVSVMIVILILRIPTIRLFAVTILMSLVSMVTFIILLAAIMTPDNQSCGHPRNKLALCYPLCPIITTDFSFYWPVALIGGASILVSMAIGCCWRLDRADVARNSASAAAAAASRREEEKTKTKTENRSKGGGGEEGDGQEYLHRQSKAWRPLSQKENDAYDGDI